MQKWECEFSRYELLLCLAGQNGATVYENYDFTNTRLKGLYGDGIIALGKSLSEYDKNCVLAEEIGHHETSYGNILDMSNEPNRKQELKARAYAYDLLVGLNGILNAFLRGCINKFEVSEYLQVTEEFLDEALYYYRQKYGTCATIGNYVIYFEPSIGVFELC